MYPAVKPTTPAPNATLPASQIPDMSLNTSQCVAEATCALDRVNSTQLMLIVY